MSYKLTYLESGYDFITLYFKTATEMREASENLYRYMHRISFKYLDMQRKNFMHKPGDVPHFHNGIDATKGPHVHILYPHRPTEEDWKELKEILGRRLVSIDITDVKNEEIS